MLVGSSVALAALAASLLNRVDPTECLIRGGIAFAVGHICGTLWNMFFTRPQRAETENNSLLHEQETSTESTQPDGSS